jgi:hypothetical protein
MPAAAAVGPVALPRAGAGPVPGAVTIAWLRAAGRADRGRRAFPGGSPGALLVLPVVATGPRAWCRARVCRVRMIVSNHAPLTCSVLAGEQRGRG